MAERIILSEGGGDRFIVETKKDTGYLIDIRRGVKSPEMPIMSLAVHGEWIDYTGRMTPADLLARYKKARRR